MKVMARSAVDWFSLDSQLMFLDCRAQGVLARGQLSAEA